MYVILYTNGFEGEGEGYIDGVCKVLRSSVETTPMYVPQRIKIGSGSTAYYLDPTTQYSSRDKCTTGIGAQDSTCVVPYRYGVAAGLATITASFSNTSPVVGGTGTSPRWTTTNAVSLTVNCSGVATYTNANAPLQANPIGITLNSPVAGPVSCVLTAMNSDNEPTAVTITATFVQPVPPTIQASFERPNFSAGTGGSKLNWASQNAKTVHVNCSGYNWGPGYIALQGNPSGVTMDRTQTGSISCTFTATNEVGQTATATAVANVVRPPPPTVWGGYNPPNINVGQQSQLQYSSANAVAIGIVCNGLSFAAVQDPSLYLNQPWYWFAQTWPTAGTQSCGINAYNTMGEMAVAYFDLVVAPVGLPASGGGTADGGVAQPGSPTYVPPGGTSTGGRPAGYYNPNTGLTYSDPAGTMVCTSCTTDTSYQTTDTGSPPAPTPPASDDGGEGGEGGGENGGSGGSP